MSELIYLEDSYVKEFSASVAELLNEGVVLNRTAFHPRSGGVANDLGAIFKDGVKYEVVDVVFNDGKVLHVIKGGTSGLGVGDVVVGVIDWGRRYRLMRLHTAAHILAAIFYRDYNALITGGNVYPEYAYDDYSLDVFDRSVFEDVVRKANDVVKSDVEVKIYWLDRDEALRIPGVVKLASKMPPDVSRLRIVEIPGIDVQADGGPHVRRLSEVGEIVLTNIENKGKKRKRLYYSVRP
ncbi:MAG: alanyl-tRNA editing protein AlaXM [Sulfolobales archaeon]|nr:alanyl-tRNA editing protein AlaXM [Sulfolobales archaeon]